MGQSGETVNGGTTLRLPDGVPLCARCRRPIVGGGPVLCGPCERAEEDQEWRDRGGVELSHRPEWFGEAADRFAAHADAARARGLHDVARTLDRAAREYRACGELLRRVRS